VKDAAKNILLRSAPAPCRLSASGQTPAGFELTLFDLDGTSKVVGRLPASVYAPRVSPDGKRVAFETRDPAGPDGPRLWVADLADLDGRRPFAPTPGPMNWAPMWTTDGERLVYLVSGERRTPCTGGAPMAQVPLNI
jgi:Tol biopolymer transport system component